MENAVRQRIIKIFNEYHINPSQFSGEDGAMQKRLSRQLKGGASVTCETLLSILDRYNDVSAEWLLRGEGNMMKCEHDRALIDDSTIYHYTNADSLFKIIKSLTLKFSDLSKSNDLKERALYKKKLHSSGYDKNKAIEGLNEYKTISFCQESISLNNLRKFEHPRMWSHYGENHKGACIAINVKALNDNNNNIPILYSKVKYDKLGFIKDGKSIEDEINIKHVDWEQEREIKLIHKGMYDSINIEGCIETIYLGYDFKEFEALSRIIYNPNWVFYKKITPFSFSKVVNRDGMIYGEKSPSALFPREMVKYASEGYREWMIQYLGLDENIFDGIDVLQISPETVSEDNLNINDMDMKTLLDVIRRQNARLDELERENTDLRRKYEPLEERPAV